MLTALLLSDVHGRVSVLRSILKRGSFDVALVAGDVSNYSGGAYREVLETISRSAPIAVVVPGNVDPPEVAGLGIENVLVIHKEVVEVGGLRVAGAGGGLGFPFWGIPYLTEAHMSSFVEELERALKPGSLPLHVLLTHTPPEATGLDRIYSGEYVGSRRLREFVEAYGPVLHVCGHVHEGRGVTRIGRTVAVNPGPAMVGYYGIARFGEGGWEVEVELARV